jgi:hypothetical protein
MQLCMLRNLFGEMVVRMGVALLVVALGAVEEVLFLAQTKEYQVL